MTNQIKVIGSNQTQLTRADGTIIFYSYNTPVCAWIGNKLYKTNKKWSNTTSKHINAYIGNCDAELKDQSFFDNL